MFSPVHYRCNALYSQAHVFCVSLQNFPKPEAENEVMKWELRLAAA
jgi:hypothetical protein